MSFTTPTLSEAVKQARANLRAELPGTDANVWPNTNYVYAKVWGGLQFELFQYLSWISRQRFATTADADMLDEHGAQFGLARNPATYANGEVNITGTAGYTISEGTILETADGIQFETLRAVTLDAGGSGTVDVQAIVTGPSSNVIATTSLTPAETDASITSVAVDDIGLGGGANIEADESYRARILLRLRYPPHGGAAHDYVFWSLKITGVTRVWVDPLAYGPGTVGVWFMADDTTANGIPNATMVGDVATYIESQKPVTARVTVAAPVAGTTDIKISGLGVISTDRKTLIENELKDLFRRAVQVSTPSTPFTLNKNLIWQAVARAMGSSSHTVSIPVEDVTYATGIIPVLGDICYLQ